ncbi:MAG: MopE-related protein [Verrucomicrobiia bacterium]
MKKLMTCGLALLLTCAIAEAYWPTPTANFMVDTPTDVDVTFEGYSTAGWHGNFIRWSPSYRWCVSVFVDTYIANPDDVMVNASVSSWTGLYGMTCGFAELRTILQPSGSGELAVMRREGCIAAASATYSAVGSPSTGDWTWTIRVRGHFFNPNLDIDDDTDGFTENQGDCDDSNPLIHPGAVDIPANGMDEDCDGQDATDPSLTDDDGDGFSEAQGDCDDSNPLIHSGAVDIPANGIDEDCDGQDATDPSLTDDDGDGFSETQGDCDDSNPLIHSGAADIPANGIDEDCDGQDSTDPLLTDDDGDGFSETQGDCDDSNPLIHPGAVDIPANGIDEDCDGQDATDPSLTDDDGDGFSEAQGDCDDSNPLIHPGAVDIPANGIDEDCDGQDATCEEGLYVTLSVEDSEPVNYPKFSRVVMAAYFTPPGGIQHALECSGYSRFNYYQKVLYFPAGFFPTGFSLGFVDPPLGGFGGDPADQLPFYWDEGPVLVPKYHISGHLNDATLDFCDLPIDSRFDVSNPDHYRKYYTALVGIRSDNTFDVLDSWTWKSNFNLKDGGVFFRNLGLTSDSDEGGGGIFELKPHLTFSELPLELLVDLYQDGAANLPEDLDGDGVPNQDDACVGSDTSSTVVIDGCDSTVSNRILANGYTVSDLIRKIAESASTHGEFVGAVTHLAKQLTDSGLMPEKERGKLISCAAQSAIPKLR